MNTTEHATVADPLPGNLSTRQLARSLTKPATEPKTEVKTEAADEAPPGDREVPDPEKEQGDEPQPEHSTTDPEAAPEGTEEEGTEEPEAAAEAEAEGTEEAPTEAEVPPTISDAVSRRLNAELAPLVEELKKVGAKGALQVLQKRIPKLVDARDTERNGRLAAEEQARQLRTELQEARTARPEKPASDGAVHPEVAALHKELATTDQWLGWCEENAAGGELPDGKGGKLELDEKGVRSLRRELEKQRTDLAAQKAVTEQQVKEAYRALHTQHHAAAVKEFPWVAKTDAPEYQEMQGILQAFPAFKQAPDYELMIGDYLSGRKLREQRAKTRGVVPASRKAPPSREPTKLPAEAPGGGARKADAGDEVAAAEAQFKKSGKSSDLAKWSAAKAKAARSKK